MEQFRAFSYVKYLLEEMKSKLLRIQLLSILHSHLPSGKMHCAPKLQLVRELSRVLLAPPNEARIKNDKLRPKDKNI